MKNLYKIFNQRRGKAEQPYSNHFSKELDTGEIKATSEIKKKKMKLRHIPIKITLACKQCGIMIKGTKKRKYCEDCMTGNRSYASYSSK